MEGVSLVVSIIDEAVAPVVPLWQWNSQPGIHILQKLPAIMDCLQSRVISVVRLSRAAWMEESDVTSILVSMSEGQQPFHSS